MCPYNYLCSKENLCKMSIHYYPLNVTLVLSELVSSSLAQSRFLRTFLCESFILLFSRFSFSIEVKVHSLALHLQIWSVCPYSGDFLACSADMVIISFPQDFCKTKIWPHLRFGPFRRLKSPGAVTAFCHFFLIFSNVACFVCIRMMLGG